MLKSSIRVKTRVLAGDSYTVSEAARLLKVNPSTIWRWIDAGLLPAYRVGPRRIRIRRVDLEGIIRPVRGERVTTEREDIWAGYDPKKALKAFRKSAGRLKGIDADDWIAKLYRAREDGSRPAGRP